MSDIVDCCRVWESHRDVEIETRISADGRPAHAVCQVTVDKQIPTTPPKTENLEDIIMKLLPALRPSQAIPIPSDTDVLIRQLMEAICPPTPVAQERLAATELEILLLNWLPVGTVMEEDATSPDPPTDSAVGCFSCGDLTHMTDQCRTLDKSFPFLPTGMQAEHIRDQFILGPGPPASPQDQQMGNAD